MSSIKRHVRQALVAAPGGRRLWYLLGTFRQQSSKPEFDGWGMINYTSPPWSHGGGDDIARNFLETNARILANVKNGDFRLSQFADVADKYKLLHQLMWRHYIVFWSATFACQSTCVSVNNLVECGVCDGLTAFFALHAARTGNKFKAFLYDAWEGMKEQDLLDSEKVNAGAYSYLDVENTRRNLVSFQSSTVFNRGRIPEIFKTSENPADVVWIHIDLNSSIPTTASLEFFFDRMVPGGVALFDDYSWPGYHETKTAVDSFFAGKNGTLLPLPTGQAIYFKR